MGPTLTALVLFAGWTLLLVLVVATYRGVVSARSGKALNTFSPDGGDIDALGRRLTRAHLNCLETLPAFAAVALSAVAAGRADVTDGLAMPLFYARVAQSVVHMISTSIPMVFLRATLFVVQIGILLFWIWKLVL